MIKPSEFKDWQEYYWTYQNTLAKKYLIPMLERQGVGIDGKSVFEIGCGSGGVIEAFAERCTKAVGVDITPFDYTKLNTPKVKYITADIYDKKSATKYADQYDLIVFRDVIEHLPKKKEAFEICDRLLKQDGRIYITFPPFYSAFGAHQQVFSRSRIGKLPFTHLMPRAWYLKFVGNVEKGNQPAMDLALEMENAKTSIHYLNKILKSSAFEIQYQEYYLTRPSFEIRYGIKPRKVQWLRYIPILREFVVMGVYMILRRKTK